MQVERFALAKREGPEEFADASSCRRARGIHFPQITREGPEEFLRRGIPLNMDIILTRAYSQKYNQSMSNKITNEQLAAMIQRGFQETASKSYVDERFTHVDERFAGIDERFNILTDSIRIMQDDIHDIKISLGPLVRMVATMDTDLQNLTQRVSRLERKVGVGK